MGNVVDLFPRPEKKPLKLTPRGEKVVNAITALKEKVAKPAAAVALGATVAVGAGAVATEVIKGKPAEIKIVPQEGQPYRLVRAGQEYTNPQTHQTENLITLTQIVEAGYGDRIPTADGVEQLRTGEQIDPSLLPGEEIHLSPDAAIGELVDPNAQR